ncbi:hypothetical protein B0H11DRAFT_509387 [Mycena galericulata]|nr:hypothetical protein B0H11DRAFT_509387 [Mycena galericulata]
MLLSHLSVLATIRLCWWTTGSFAWEERTRTKSHWVIIRQSCRSQGRPCCDVFGPYTWSFGGGVVANKVIDYPIPHRKSQCTLIICCCMIAGDLRPRERLARQRLLCSGVVKVHYQGRMYE